MLSVAQRSGVPRPHRRGFHRSLVRNLRETSFFHKRSYALTITTNVFVDSIQRHQVHCCKRSEDVGMTSDRLFNHQQRQHN